MTAWTPIGRLALAAAGTDAPRWPVGVQPFRRVFENWSKEIYVERVWTLEPTSAEQIAEVATWAAANGWKVRPRGFAHNWSPIVVHEGAGDRVLLLDLRATMAGFRVAERRPDGSAVVTVGTGLALADLLSRLEADGYGVAAGPAPGDVTVGGVLAIGGHGTGLSGPARDKAPGETFSSLSNLITALTAVVWDQAAGRYVVRTFQRDDPAIGPLLVHVGRAVVTEVSLAVAPNRNLRCRSRTDLTVDDLFAPTGGRGRTFMELVDRDGACEVIWFPFTDVAWTKTWSVAPTRPRGARIATRTGNYGFSDRLPRPLVAMMEQVTRGSQSLTPAIMWGQLLAVQTGLALSGTADLWGPSKNTLLYVNPDTLRVTANGYAVTCRRRDAQLVLARCVAVIRGLMDDEARAGRYPFNGPLEARVVELDDPADCGVDGAVEAPLSVLRRSADHLDHEVAIYLDVLSIPDTAGANGAYAQLEGDLVEAVGDRGQLRPEWSKGWGYSAAGPWSDESFITRHVPEVLSHGPGRDGFRDAADALRALDPAGVFATELHERLFGG